MLQTIDIHTINFGNSIDFDLLIQNIVDLKEGKAIEKPDYDLPSCAKDWPYDLSNFWIDEDGFVWRDEIGCCTGYTITRIEIRIKWADMRHLLRKDFIVPSFDL